MLTFKEFLNESDYKIEDGKVLITKKNYDKKHRDYKGGKKGSETLLVLDPKDGATTSMPVEFVNESSSKDLESFKDFSGLEEKEIKGEKEAYQKFFDSMLKKYGVESPEELSDEEKKKFFDEVDAGWKSDKEEKED